MAAGGGDQLLQVILAGQQSSRGLIWPGGLGMGGVIQSPVTTDTDEFSVIF